eukprot:CAMPEP_0185174898 /NCGR_PEP_ID=MMETSP1139-20130426/25938_1 /TAXON_ID=298111 /ORGANISM="Pavlova sp., Strain CCMP459" /LENGTH=87 /DNA_ID=CAMNT_0027740627 /DNA_START=520 /DNA_END=783 /DNA_ORIENTATION=+
MELDKVNSLAIREDRRELGDRGRGVSQEAQIGQLASCAGAETVSGPEHTPSPVKVVSPCVGRVGPCHVFTDEMHIPQLVAASGGCYE